MSVHRQPISKRIWSILEICHCQGQFYQRNQQLGVEKTDRKNSTYEQRVINCYATEFNRKKDQIVTSVMHKSLDNKRLWDAWAAQMRKPGRSTESCEQTGRTGQRSRCWRQPTCETQSRRNFLKREEVITLLTTSNSIKLLISVKRESAQFLPWLL